MFKLYGKMTSGLSFSINLVLTLPDWIMRFKSNPPPQVVLLIIEGRGVLVEYPLLYNNSPSVTSPGREES